MKEYPSVKIMIISILLLLLYFNLKFYLEMNQTFSQQKYDWQKMQKIDSTLGVNVLFATKNRLKIQAAQKMHFSASHTYSLQNNDTDSYFRYEYLNRKEGQITFYDIHWLKSIPKNLSKPFKLIKLDLPLIQKGQYTAITIGDENFCRYHDEDFRKELAKQGMLRFVGRQKDVLGFPMEAAVDWSSQNILNIVRQATPADYIILLFRWHAQKESLDMFLQNIQQINNEIAGQKPKKIFWIVPPASTNKEADKQILQTIMRFKNNRVSVINPYQFNKTVRLQDANSLYNASTMKQLAHEIAKQL